MEPTAIIYDIQGFSVHDGPGIRTTVFLKGCPLRCPWCHSPESQSFEPQVCFKRTSCRTLDECGKCLAACPQHGIFPDERHYSTLNESGDAIDQHFPHINKALCDDCGACTQACAPKALYVCGKEWSVSEVLKRVAKDRAFYDASGGGVTISGGEPLSQLDFTTALLRSLKERGFHTALDTTGFASSAAVEEVLPYVDLFLLDLKHMDSETHKRVIGVPNEIIHANALLIARRGGAIQVRIPTIPLFNDSAENMEETARFCEELGDAVAYVQLLPYHTLGTAKYERLQTDEVVFEATPPTDTHMEEIARIFSDKGISVTIH